VSEVKRRDELSLLNVCFCLLVVLIHVLSWALPALRRDSIQYTFLMCVQRLSFVAVPGFFLLSGVKLTLRPPDMKSLGRYYVRRAWTILVPYLIAVTVYYAWLVHVLWMEPGAGALLTGYLTGRIASHFYFVVALVQFILLTPLWLWLVKKYHPAVLLPLSVAVMWVFGHHLGDMLRFWDVEFPYSDRVFTAYLFYYLAGCCIGKNYQSIRALLRRHRVLLILALLVFALGDIWGSWLRFSREIDVPFLEAVHQAYFACGILVALDLALTVRRIPGPVRFLDQISYLIYLYHALALNAFAYLYGKLVMDQGLFLLFRAAFVYLTTIAACALWHFGIVRIVRILRERQRS